MASKKYSNFEDRSEIHINIILTDAPFGRQARFSQYTDYAIPAADN
jgi:hypothetical protein